MSKRPAKCGTDGGYYRHLRITKTEPCEACRQAHAQRKRQLQAKPLGKCPCGTQLRTDHQYCSRCRRKLERAEARRGGDDCGDFSKPSPSGWVRRGLIWHPVYEQSEVA